MELPFTGSFFLGISDLELSRFSLLFSRPLLSYGRSQRSTTPSIFFFTTSSTTKIVSDLVAFYIALVFPLSTTRTAFVVVVVPLPTTQFSCFLCLRQSILDTRLIFDSPRLVDRSRLSTATNLTRPSRLFTTMAPTMSTPKPPSKPNLLNADIWHIIIQHQIEEVPEDELEYWRYMYSQRPALVDPNHTCDPTTQFDDERVPPMRLPARFAEWELRQMEEERERAERFPLWDEPVPVRTPVSPPAQWDFKTLIALSKTNRMLNDVVGHVLYKNIVIGWNPNGVGIDRAHTLPLLRTLALRPDFRHRVKHITIEPDEYSDKRHKRCRRSPHSLLGKGATKKELEVAKTFLRPEDIKKLDMEAQIILRTAGLDLGPSKHHRKRAPTPFYERMLAALVCFCPQIRTLRFLDTVYEAEVFRDTAFDIDGFEGVIRLLRENPATGGDMFQSLQAVTIRSGRQKLRSREAFSVWSSPSLTGFQLQGFLSMKDW